MDIVLENRQIFTNQCKGAYKRSFVLEHALDNSHGVLNDFILLVIELKISLKESDVYLVSNAVLGFQYQNQVSYLN